MSGTDLRSIARQAAKNIAFQTNGDTSIGQQSRDLIADAVAIAVLGDVWKSMRCQHDANYIRHLVASLLALVETSFGEAQQATKLPCGHGWHWGAECDEPVKPEAGPMRNAESPSGVQALGSSGPSQSFGEAVPLEEQKKDIEFCMKCHGGQIPDTDDAPAEVVLSVVCHCASLWENGARLLGNVRATDIQRAAAAGAAALRGSAWRSIASAPKDGTRILTIDMDRREPMAVAATWFGSAWYTVPGAYLCHPTHWMPLPDPPTVVGHVHSDTSAKLERDR